MSRRPISHLAPWRSAEPWGSWGCWAAVEDGAHSSADHISTLSGDKIRLCCAWKRGTGIPELWLCLGRHPCRRWQGRDVAWDVEDIGCIFPIEMSLGLASCQAAGRRACREKAAQLLTASLCSSYARKWKLACSWGQPLTGCSMQQENVIGSVPSHKSQEFENKASIPHPWCNNPLSACPTITCFRN